MRFLVLIFMVILLIMRVKEIPIDLSKDAYQKKFESKYAKNESFFQNKSVFLQMMFVENLFFGLCYAYVWFSSFSIILNILSMIQIITLMITIRYIIIDCIEKDNIVSTYHRNYLLFNMILDALYYPLTIVALLFK